MRLIDYAIIIVARFNRVAMTDVVACEFIHWTRTHGTTRTSAWDNTRENKRMGQHAGTHGTTRGKQTHEINP